MEQEQRGITPDHVLAELAGIAFADLGSPEGPPIKPADKLRALEMIYKYLRMGEGDPADEGVVIVDGD